MKNYSSMFKDKNYYIGIAVGIVAVLVFQKFVKK